MKTSDKTNEVTIALAKAKAAMPYPKTDGKNDHFKSKYASLIAVLAVVMPALREHDLDIIQWTEYLPECGKDCLYTQITYLKSGQFLLFGPTRLAMKDSDDPQKYGGSATYAKRREIVSICMLAEDDDDGNRAAKPRSAPKNAPKKESGSKPPKESPPSNGPTGALIFNGPIEKVFDVKQYGEKRVCNIKVIDPDTGEIYDVGIWGSESEEVAKLKPKDKIKIEYSEKVEWEKEGRSGVQLKNPVIVEIEHADVPF